MQGDKSHSLVRIPSDKYRDNYDRIFRGKKEEEPAERELADWVDVTCPNCEAKYGHDGMVAEDKFGYFCVISGCGWHDNFKINDRTKAINKMLEG